MAKIKLPKRSPTGAVKKRARRMGRRRMRKDFGRRLMKGFGLSAVYDEHLVVFMTNNKRSQSVTSSVLWHSVLSRVSCKTML